MIYTQPSESFEATVDWGQTGLVGTLGVEILDNVGGTSVVRTTSGVIEIASGIYSASLTAPATAGQYSVVWDDTLVFTPDDLVVLAGSTLQVVSGDGMTLGDILDAILFKRFTSSFRPRAKQAVNSRYGHLWALEDWTFKFATVNPETTADSQQLGNLPLDFGVPLYLWDENGAKLDYLNTDVFYNAYLPDNSTGSPEAWTVVNEEILLGPTPASDATYTMHYRKRLSPLVNEGDVPAIPAAFHLALVHGGRAELKAAFDDPTATADEAQWQLDIEAMRREWLADAEGQPDTWPDDLHAVG